MAHSVHQCYYAASQYYASRCYRRSSVVCHDREPGKNGWTDHDAIWFVDKGGPKVKWSE